MHFIPYSKKPIEEDIQQITADGDEHRDGGS